MIDPPKNSNAHLLSAWGAGIALLFLGIGLHGASEPLVPVVEFKPGAAPMLEIMAADFDPPPAAAPMETNEPATEAALEDIEIPSVVEVAAPLTMPEMVELTPLTPVVERSKPLPVVSAPPPKPQSRNQTDKRAPSPQPTGQPGGTGTPQLFSGGGKGRFPSPYYPASARRAGMQGSVQLDVTVEASGLPSRVTVTKSSGHALLDTTARDQVQRRWRWPVGNVRRILVPIRFQLE